jgi:hypothetical protein
MAQQETSTTGGTDRRRIRLKDVVSASKGAAADGTSWP